jgi:hypothetical protein
LRTEFLADTFALKEEETGDWGKQHKEKLHNSFSSPNIITVKKKKIHWICLSGGKCVKY